MGSGLRRSVLSSSASSLSLSILLCAGCSGDAADTTFVAQEVSASPLHDHEHGLPAEEAGDVVHRFRDIETEPCNVENWRELGLDLRECDLAGAPLARARLRRVDLTGADLGHAHLEQADLFKARLTGASVNEAHLSGANLTSADLRDADLTGARLDGARLTNAELTGAIVDGATTDQSTMCPAGTPGPCW